MQQSPAAGRSSACRQDSAASLMFGAPPPVLDGAARGGGQPRAERRAPSPQPRAPSQAAGGPLRGLVPVAGAGANQQPRAREQQEMEGERRGRAKPVDLDRVWDDYEAHVEDNAFEKMRGTLGRLERRASREFELYRGAAGWSSEKLQERDDRQNRKTGQTTDEMLRNLRTVREYAREEQESVNYQDSSQIEVERRAVAEGVHTAKLLLRCVWQRVFAVRDSASSPAGTLRGATRICGAQPHL